ncbi:MAG: hypothetical protein V4723_14935 [Pseudomonadota bacterium]
MRKRFGQMLRIGVSRHGLALVKTRRWGAAAPEVLGQLVFGAADMPGYEGMAAGVRRLLLDTGCARWQASVVLADDLVRMWQVAPPPGAARLADLEAAAALRFRTLFGDNPAAWTMAAGWNASQPFLAAAMPRQLLALLEQTAREQQVDLVAIAPQFVAGWNQWRHALKPGAWYAQVQQRVLTMGVVEGRALSTVRAAALPDGASLDWLGQHVAREALRLNVAAPVRIAIAGSAPLAWNSSAGDLACTLLAPGQGADWPDAVRLALTGSRA